MRMSDPKPECPECGASEVKKQVSAAAFSLKGGGWYKDGYSGPSNTAGKGSDSGSKSGGGSDS
jgi:predicted nucleic acid-binding Zn ribbon protein